MNFDWYRMYSMIKGVYLKSDGRKKVCVWIRINEKNEIIFIVLYLVYCLNGEGYMNIFLLFLFSSMIGILKFYYYYEKLVLISRWRKSGVGDEGIYL